jgi:hypothetical protein
METSMRVLGCIIAAVLVLSGPSLAGPADGDLPGVGTFDYRGPPIAQPALDMVAQLGR